MSFLTRNAAILCVALSIFVSSQSHGQQVTRVIKLNSKKPVTQKAESETILPTAPDELPDPSNIDSEQIGTEIIGSAITPQPTVPENSFVPAPPKTEVVQQQTPPQKSNAFTPPIVQQPQTFRGSAAPVVEDQPLSSSFSTSAKNFTAPQVSEIEPKENLWAEQGKINKAIPAITVSSGRIATQPSPIVTTQISAPPFVNIGRPTSIEIKLVNSGVVVARNVQLIATLPENARFVSSQPQPVKNDGREITFNLSDINSKRYGSVILELVPTSRESLDIETQVLVDNRQKIEVSVRQPKLTTEINGPTEITIGSVTKHSITVENSGDGIAANIQIRPATNSQIQTTVIPQFIPTLNPGERTQVTVTTVCNQPGQYDLDLQLESTGLKTKTLNRQLTVFQPELQVAARGPNMTYLNRTGLYSIEIKNVGGSAISNVEVVLDVPLGIQITTISKQAEINQQTGQLIWKFNQLPANTTELIQMRGMALAQGEQVSRITVRSSETSSKNIQLKTQVASRADVKISISNETGPIRSGTKSVFAIEVENRGSSLANNVRVHAELPASTIPITSANYHVNELENAIHFPPMSLKPGEKRTLKFEAGGVAQGEHVVRSVLQLGETQRRIIAEDSVFVFAAEEEKVTEALKSDVRR